MSFRTTSAVSASVLWRSVVVCLVACLGLATLASARQWWVSRTAVGSLKNSPLVTLQDKPAPEPHSVEEITLRPEGFYPAELTRSKGNFLLVVCNRAGIEEMNFVLTRETGSSTPTKEKVKEAKVQRRILDWNDELDLNPGAYLLTEASNPKWVCRINITPK
jgi:hypothetical protein